MQLSCFSPVPTWKLSKYVKRPPSRSSKMSPNRAFGIRWTRCNISLKTSSDHQLPMSAVSTVHLNCLDCLTPQCMSGAIIIRKPLSPLSNSKNPKVESTVLPPAVNEVWTSYYELLWKLWMVARCGSCFPRDEGARCSRTLCVVVAVELAAASAGQTPFDPLSK